MTLLSTVKEYFDKNAHFHAYHNDPSVYLPILELLKSNHKSNNLKILDVGCGDGSFIKGLKKMGIAAEFFGIDLSSSMIQMANQNLTERDVYLMVGDLFKLPLRPDLKFDIIHLDSVLHHIIGKNVTESKRLVMQILSLLTKRLSVRGSLIIEEVFYNSHLYPSITSSVIFYSLKFCNYFKFDMRRIIPEFPPGLEVDFFHEKELKNMLDKFGDLHLIKRVQLEVPRFYKIFLLKSFGHISWEVRTD